MDMDAFKTDLIKSSLQGDHNISDPNKLADLYNSELRQLLDKHAPEVSRSITLRPHQSAKNAAASVPTELQALRCIDRSTEINVGSIRPIDQCKTQYYKSKIESADQR